jgi:hypothetical protein
VVIDNLDLCPNELLLFTKVRQRVLAKIVRRINQEDVRAVWSVEGGVRIVNPIEGTAF